MENAIEHAFVLCDNDRIELLDLPIEIRQTDAATASYRPPLPNDPPYKTRSRKKISKETLIDLLKECDWNKAEVGRRVGLSRTAIWKYMKKWEIPLKPAE